MWQLRAKENLNLPLTSSATEQVWRAASRIGCAVHGTIIWGSTVPNGKKQICVISRVLEKDTFWTHYVLDKILAHCVSKEYLKPWMTVVHWSDGAPHYRSVASMAFWGWHHPEKYKIHTEIRFGLEHHLKGAVDRYFGRLSKRIHRHAKHTAVKSAQQVHDVFRAEAADSEEHLIVMPDIERDAFVLCHPSVVRASLPLAVKSAHQYHFQAAAITRVNFVGRDRRSITGVEVRWAVMFRIRVPPPTGG